VITLDINSFLRRKGKKWLLLDLAFIINMAIIGIYNLIWIIVHITALNSLLVVKFVLLKKRRKE